LQGNDATLTDDEKDGIRYSFITGTIKPINKTLSMKGDENQLITVNNGTGEIIEAKNGSTHLINRSWKGLEMNIGQTEVVMAVQGREGIAMAYNNELEKDKINKN